MKYDIINQVVLSRIPRNVKRILDVGCGPGVLGGEIKQLHNCEVIGITNSNSEANLASKSLYKVFVRDLDVFDPYELCKFDCVLCSHVLEHLCCPQKLLERLRNNISFNGVLIVVLPNVLHWKQRLEFLKGNFTYKDEGLMDYTHVRFFDYKSALKLIQESGYEVLSKVANGNFPLPIIRKLVKPVARIVDNLAIRAMPGLFGVQFIFIACIKRHLERP